MIYRARAVEMHGASFIPKEATMGRELNQTYLDIVESAVSARRFLDHIAANLARPTRHTGSRCPAFGNLCGAVGVGSAGVGALLSLAARLIAGFRAADEFVRWWRRAGGGCIRGF